MFSIEYSRAARKALKAMPRNTARLILEKIESLAIDPMAPNNNVKKLTNHPGYRLRVGDWRIVYTIHEQALLIAVVRIAPRGDVYQ
ncbi:type II toxin-antitoxin system RelE family toxin [Geomobilimonas luticola]|uniref:Type II toxin-antitoxin system RelE/ParE family toxin n=1 Tax=Geomobilimonas luticola TaxID=1114878 RepID=A0ABS5SHR3_9BACT|nr:type II toxin-antitoxin system RelE/ParE family toxin [Geomobilimonas luticola]MBT0654104.1 type II toxin-antitoxin system RelE/ParE family toxin [Geomobilimonas luticola]